VVNEVQSTQAPPTVPQEVSLAVPATQAAPFQHWPTAQTHAEPEQWRPVTVQSRQVPPPVPHWVSEVPVMQPLLPLQVDAEHTGVTQVPPWQICPVSEQSAQETPPLPQAVLEVPKVQSSPILQPAHGRGAHWAL
jgi:hypothetical protein